MTSERQKNVQVFTLELGWSGPRLNLKATPFICHSRWGNEHNAYTGL